ncbi:MAG TPA: hypothetical protein VMV05_04860 [bacterium]|nr:hypothetical protein [bacterium]
MKKLIAAGMLGSGLFAAACVLAQNAHLTPVTTNTFVENNIDTPVPTPTPVGTPTLSILISSTLSDPRHPCTPVSVAQPLRKVKKGHKAKPAPTPQPAGGGSEK